MSTTTNETRWVLIAEDDQDIREMIRDSIASECEDAPVEIVEAKDGLEALNQATHRQFHCVVTDLRMPRSTGEDFIRSLQTHPLNANTPMLVISGHARDEFREFCDRYSHIKVIPKPFEPNDVAKAVLREIKLGRLDDRISIHLMNPFLGSLHKLLEEEMKLDCTFLQPEVKKAGDVLVGDYHCTMMLTTGITRARFTFSFDKQLLDYARQSFFQSKNSPVKQWAGLSVDDVARLMIQALIERGSEQIGVCMGDTPRLGGLSIVTSKNESALENLVDAGGAKVLVRTNKGRVCAGAYSRPKLRRI